MAGSDTGGYGGLAGDLFLRLAADGRLALEPAQAAVIVDELVRTLDSVHILLRCASGEPRESAADWLIPGDRHHPPELPPRDLDQRSLEAARRELPKYIEAFRLLRDQATRPNPAT